MYNGKRVAERSFTRSLKSTTKYKKAHACQIVSGDYFLITSKFDIFKCLSVHKFYNVSKSESFVNDLSIFNKKRIYNVTINNIEYILYTCIYGICTKILSHIVGKIHFLVVFPVQMLIIFVLHASNILMLYLHD